MGYIFGLVIGLLVFTPAVLAILKRIEKYNRAERFEEFKSLVNGTTKEEYENHKLLGYCYPIDPLKTFIVPKKEVED